MKIFTLSIILLGCTLHTVRAQIHSKKYNSETNVANWPEEFDPAKAKFYVYNEIEINASPEVIWNILLDAEEWPKWYVGAKNVDVLDASNQLNLNTAFNWETMGLKFQSVVKEFVPNARLSWQSYKKSIPGYHAWVIIPIATGCKLITAESQHGWLTKMEKTFQPNKLLNYHDTWLQEIKKKAKKKNELMEQYSVTNQCVLSDIERKILVDLLTASLEKFNTAVAGLSTEQFTFRAKEDKWTITECIEHITLTELRFPEIVMEKMKSPPDPDGRKKIKIADDAIRGRIINRFWKVKSPERLLPTGKFTSTAIALDTFRKQRKETLVYIQTTQDDLRNHFWEHRATGIIDLYQTLILMSGHLERHTAQIAEVKQSKKFPK